MVEHFEDYTREQLMLLLRERDKRPRFDLVTRRRRPVSGKFIST